MLLISFSNTLARLESLAARCMVVLVLLLIVVNIVTRYTGIPIYWIDELAIYAMIWMVFITLPSLVAKRKNISVNIIVDLFGPRPEKLLCFLSDFIICMTSGLMLHFSISWFDPIGLIKVDMDINNFSISTFNYIYHEPTNTLAFNKFIVWSVIPVSFLLCVLHGFINMIISLVDIFKEKGGES